MALQGTLDTFALADVMRLLGSTRKTGRLRVTGTRGAGSVWFDGGGVVAAGATGVRSTAPAGAILFELLRYADGAFVFEPDVAAHDAGAPLDVTGLLEESEARLAEWREIEAVVPSLACWVGLAEELPAPEVVVDAERWAVIVAVGAGGTVASVGDRLDADEVAVSRAVKDLVEAGFAVVRDAPPAPAAVAAAPTFDLTDTDTGIATDAAAADAVADAHVDAAPYGPAAPDLMAETMVAQLRPPAPDAKAAPLPVPGTGELGIDIPGFASLSGGATPHAAVTPDDDLDIARRLGTLTPRAARAIAAAARAGTDEERDAALADARDCDDEPLDRGLLLRFLSSVKH